ncbi:MAG TPA: pilus assembly protein N-terminal domain-containing protein [Brevundimonas sp.]
MFARIALRAGYIAMTVTTRRLALPAVSALVAVLAMSVAGPGLTQSSVMDLVVDTSQRVAVRGAISSIIVANPQIADATVVDANTLFVTGKGYGSTQITAVDAIGRILFQNQIVVTGGQAGAVRVWRGGRVTEMACAASCSPSVRSDGGASATPTP